LRGCNKYNRNAKLPWSFQIDTRILFDDLDYDPQRSPYAPGPQGGKSGGLYEITQNPDKSMSAGVAGEICTLTNIFLTEQKALYSHYKYLINERRKGREGHLIHKPRKLSAGEKAQVEEWLTKQSRKGRYA
jgi:hypothetical protein